MNEFVNQRQSTMLQIKPENFRYVSRYFVFPSTFCPLPIGIDIFRIYYPEDIPNKSKQNNKKTKYNTYIMLFVVKQRTLQVSLVTIITFGCGCCVYGIRLHIKNAKLLLARYVHALHKAPHVDTRITQKNAFQIRTTHKTY